MNKLNQIDIVLDIVKENAPIRTEGIKIRAMRQGVSCADRYLRWLKELGKIVSYKPDRKDGRKDACLTWKPS